MSALQMKTYYVVKLNISDVRIKKVELVITTVIDRIISEYAVRSMAKFIWILF